MEPIWRLIWSGGDEVGATGGLVDQQLEDDDGHYVDLQWSEATNSQIISFTANRVLGAAK